MEIFKRSKEFRKETFQVYSHPEENVLFLRRSYTLLDYQPIIRFLDIYLKIVICSLTHKSAFAIFVLYACLSMDRCLECRKVVAEDDRAVQCDGPCELWIHLGCGTGISVPDYNRMVAGDLDKSYTCPGCYLDADLDAVPVAEASAIPVAESTRLDLSPHALIPAVSPVICSSDSSAGSSIPWGDYSPRRFHDALDASTDASSGSSSRLSDGTVVEPSSANHGFNLSETLPNVVIPVVHEESDINNSIPAEGHAAPLGETRYVQTATGRKGASRLVDSNGFTYNIQRRNKNGSIIWQCSLRRKDAPCAARVLQTGDRYDRRGPGHSHVGEPGAADKLEMIERATALGRANPFRSGASIAEEVQREADYNGPNLLNPVNLAQRVNRNRAQGRPAHPRDLIDWHVERQHVPEYLDVHEVVVGDRTHLVLASPLQLDFLMNAKTWFVDGTFKVVREPFKQLFSIHAFIRNGDALKQVPVLFAIMSGARISDYRAVFYEAKQIVLGMAVQAIVCDFEAAIWHAIRAEFPEVTVRGCAFHWTQAVWRKTQQLGLQVPFQQDRNTRRYLQKLMALPLLPSEHIQPVFACLQEQAATQPLQELCDYIEQTWITRRIWPPTSWSVFYQPIRSNNDVEGWHQRFNRRARGSKLHLYLLMELLSDESRTVTCEMRLLDDHVTTRYQRRMYRNVHRRLFAIWEEYITVQRHDLRAALAMLDKLKGIYHPSE